MIVDFKCTNISCKNFEVPETKMIQIADLDKQVCEICKEPMSRIWNSSFAIKTSDGFKK